MSDKSRKYQALLPKVKALVEKEAGIVANLANISAAIAEDFEFLWIGFYLVKNN